MAINKPTSLDSEIPSQRCGPHWVRLNFESLESICISSSLVTRMTKPECYMGKLRALTPSTLSSNRGLQALTSSRNPSTESIFGSRYGTFLLNGCPRKQASNLNTSSVMLLMCYSRIVEVKKVYT